MTGLIGWTSLILLGLGALSGLFALFAVAMLKNKDVGAGIITLAPAVGIMAPSVYFSARPWIAPLGAILVIALMFLLLFTGGKMSSRKKVKKAKAESKRANDEIVAAAKAAEEQREKETKELQDRMDEIARSTSSSFTPTADPQPVPVTGKIDYNRRR